MSKISQNLKDYFAPVGAGVLAAALTFLPVTDKLGNTFDATAHAQDVKTVKHTPVSVHVPMLDARNNSEGAVGFLAASKAENSIVLAFYGNNAQLLEDTKEAAREAIAAGVPIRGLIVGPNVRQNSDVEVFAINQLISRPGLDSKEKIAAVIDYANRKVVQPTIKAGTPMIVP